jgi:hypothetical protein
MLEFVMRAGTRNAYMNLMKSHGFMKGNGELMPGIVSDPSPGTLEYINGIPIEPDFYHINIRITGQEEIDQTKDLPQTDEQGNLLPQYMRQLGALVDKTGTPWVAANGTTPKTLCPCDVYISTILNPKRTAIKTAQGEMKFERIS